MDNKQIADVSIVAANYNNDKYLDDFIISINSSTLLPKELIIVDDGSTDSSLSVLDKYSSLPYLKVVLFKQNRGFCNALNEGVKVATGKYIMRIDPDDIAMPYRIKNQVEFLDKNADIDGVGSNVIYFQSDTKKEVFTSNFPLLNKTISKKYYSGEHGVLHSSTMIRSDVFKKYKYNEANFKAEDYEIFARMIKDGHKFANIKEPQTKVRVHNQSVSSNIKFSVIEKTFALRDEIFNTSTNSMRKHHYFWYILYYKKFLKTESLVLKPIYLLVAVLAYPAKFYNRLTGFR